jgi:hypothetical protein
MVKGSTVEERRAAREKLSRRRQVQFHAGRVREAGNGRERLVRALNYAQAVGKDLDDAGRTELARAIASVVDGRRPQ